MFFSPAACNLMENARVILGPAILPRRPHPGAGKPRLNRSLRGPFRWRGTYSPARAGESPDATLLAPFPDRVPLFSKGPRTFGVILRPIKHIDSL